MQQEDLDFRINLVQFRIKFIFGLFCLFLLLLGSGITFIILSQDTTLFIITSSFALVTTLLIASFIFILRNRPDQSSSENFNYKPFLLLLIVIYVGIIYVISLYSVNAILGILLLSLFQGPFDLLAFGFIGAILIPKRFVLFSKKTNELQYISDFRTKRDLKTINLNNVTKIDVGSWERETSGGGSIRLYFSLKNNQNGSLNPNSGVMWSLRTYTSAGTFYELLRIFVHYPFFVRSNSKILLRPIRDVFHKVVSPTSADFSYDDSNRLSSIFQNCSGNALQEDSFSNDSGFSNNNGFSFSTDEEDRFSAGKVDSLDTDFKTIGHNKNNTVNKEIKGDKFRRINKTGAIISLFVGLVYVFNALIIIGIASDNFFGSNLLELIFNQQITPRSDQLLELIGMFLILSFLAPYLFLMSIFGREYLLFQDQLIIYRIKVLNKVFFTRNIPVKAVINIECSRKRIGLRLLGGADVTFWRGDELEQSAKLKELRTLLS